MKTVQMGDKELGLKASPLALLYYQQEFGQDLMGDLVSMQDMADMADGDFSSFDSVKILQICYAMNKANNYGKQFPDFEKWLSELNSIDFADEDFMLDVIEEATDGFFRGAKEEPQKPESKQRNK
ncbi:hypothetical protein [Sporohalobacter salinus]|uniref:hypothetical protein n=1 Tax=Sporohalobacter salinus TaxID=1494606 RepID=UPI001960DEF6|nr:hypothetical protein [Sporohalobacter salinus]MBM7624783.1 hypothetical protein [Sporohalobacter salinus]